MVFKALKNIELKYFCNNNDCNIYQHIIYSNNYYLLTFERASYKNVYSKIN